ncbi:MAG: diguanylate cyclase [Burkholderiales bacterium]
MPPGPSALALVFILYLASGWLGATLTVMAEGLAILWLPNAVVLAALIRFQAARYAAIAATALAAEIAVGWGKLPLPESALTGLVNIGEATLAYALLRRWKFDPRFAAPADLAKFVLAGPLLAALAAAFAGGAIYSAFTSTETTYLEFVRIWWFGDGLGLLILTPLLLGFRPFGVRPAAAGAGSKGADAFIWAIAVAVLALLWTWHEGRVLGVYVGPVLLLPVVIYIAARYEQRWVAAAVAVVALSLVGAVALGRSPFGPLVPRDAVIRAQEYIFVMSLLAVGLASLLAQVRLRQRDAEAANRDLRRLNDELEARVEERTVELRHANRILAELAAVDALTDLYNRRGLMDIGQREIALARRGGRNLAVMMMDLDHFKEINDRHGHQAGDETLKHCAALLKKLARASDSCGRYGGEEFVLLAPETELAGAGALAERILDEMRGNPVHTSRGEIRVTASIGVTALGARDATLADVLRRADAALYEAKAAGRDRVVAVAP